MIIINGNHRDSIRSADRGLQFGDGLFETIAVKENRPLCWDKHIERLFAGCVRLRIPPPDSHVLYQESLDAVKDMDKGVLKIIVTRGAGGRGYTPANDLQQTRILSSHEWPDYPPQARTQGIKARFCHSRLSKNSLLAGIKHLNRLEQVLARTEWDDTSIAEGIMLDIDGKVIEGTMSNLFIVKDKKVLTPLLNESGIAGIMRSLIIELCEAQKLSCSEKELSLKDLETADEIFLTNSLIGIWPVYQLGQWQYSTDETVPELLKLLKQKNYIVS